MRFLSPLITEKKSDAPGEFIMYRDFGVEFRFRGNWYREVVPKGFITDFASVPRAAQILPGFGVNESSANSSVPHDYHYCRRGKLAVTDCITGRVELIELTRKECDQLLYDGLISSGYSRAQAAMFYAAVRIGGWYYWSRRVDGLRQDFDFVPYDYDWSKP